jgi:hypothetical protein
MSLQPPRRDLGDIWRNQETEKTTMSIEEVRIKAQKLLTRSRRDLFAISAFAVLAAVFCGFVLIYARLTPARIIGGVVMAMLLANTIRNLYLSRRRNIAATAWATCLEFYRNELERQREIGRLPIWQLVTALLIIGWLTRNALMRTGSDVLRAILPFVLIAAACLIVLLAIRKFGARHVQDELDALDAFSEEKN